MLTGMTGVPRSGEKDVCFVGEDSSMRSSGAETPEASLSPTKFVFKIGGAGVEAIHAKQDGGGGVDLLLLSPCY